MESFLIIAISLSLALSASALFNMFFCKEQIESFKKTIIDHIGESTKMIENNAKTVEIDTKLVETDPSKGKKYHHNNNRFNELHFTVDTNKVIIPRRKNYNPTAKLILNGKRCSVVDFCKSNNIKRVWEVYFMFRKGWSPEEIVSLLTTNDVAKSKEPVTNELNA